MEPAVRTSRWPRGAVAAVIALLVAGPLRGGPVIVSMWGDESYTGSLQISTGGEAPCLVRMPSSGKLQEVCTTSIAPGSRELGLEGEVGHVPHGEKRPRRATGEQRLPIVDLAPMVRVLRDASVPFPARVARFLQERLRFEAAHPELAEWAEVVVTTGEPTTGEQVAKAERRLGFPLPAEHASFLREVGRLQIDDSYSMAADAVAIAHEQIQTDWGTPGEVMEHEAPELLQLFRSSTILYTEVGDGLGGLLYQPSGPPECGGPAFWWYHQEGGGPELLRNGDGSCKSYGQAMVWLLARQVLEPYDQDPTLVLVDTSSPGFRLQLVPELADGFRFRISPDWGRYE